MSNDEALRRQAQNQYQQTPSMQNVPMHTGDYHQNQIYNNELDRLRREQEERNRRG